MKFCHSCGNQVLLTAVICPNCGAAQSTQTVITHQPPAMSMADLLFSFQGRTSLWTYWFRFTFPLYALYALTWMLDSSGVLFMITFLLAIYPKLAVNVKRCHDRDRSGLFILVYFIPILIIWPAIKPALTPGSYHSGIFTLVYFIPIISLWPAIELAFIPGSYGSNRYGPDPRN